MVDITQSPCYIYPNYAASFRQDCAAVKLDPCNPRRQPCLPTITPHTLRQASVMETSTAFTVFKQRGHLESLTRTDPS